MTRTARTTRPPRTPIAQLIPQLTPTFIVMVQDVMQDAEVVAVLQYKTRDATDAITAARRDFTELLMRAEDMERDEAVLAVEEFYTFDFADMKYPPLSGYGKHVRNI